MNIKIKNSKLELIRLDFDRSTSLITIDSKVKSTLRYQEVFFFDYSAGKATSLKIHNRNTLNQKVLKGIQKEGYDEAWIIKKNSSIFKDEINYTKAEYYPIYSMAMYMSMTNRIDTLESLCHSVRDSGLIKIFYSSFGTSGLLDVRDYLKSSIKNKFKNTIVILENISTPSYQTRRKYDIYQLVKELKESKALILTDPDLIGEYTRITREIKDPNANPLKDRWSKLIGINGNRERANISIEFLENTKVIIPENTVGVEPGERVLETIKSICLVKDGTLWTRNIGIKVQDTKLIGKLKRLGIIKSSLLGNDEYNLDLINIPIVGKKKITGITSTELAKAEFNVKEISIILKFISAKKYLRDRNLTLLPEKMDKEIKSEKEIFLNNLGIYGNKYIPQETELGNINMKYSATKLTPVFHGIPSSIYREIYNFINLGNCKNIFCMNLFTQLSEELKTSSLEEMYGKYEDISQKRIKYLRELKYFSIMKKNLITKDRDNLETAVINFGMITVNWKISKEIIKA